MNKIVNLSIAEIIVSAEPIIVSTVLGSCISVCLFSGTKQAGGMIHYGLPSCEHSRGGDTLRYGSSAIPKLVEELSALTGEPGKSFKAKIIGGASNLGENSVQRSVGGENIEMARRTLAELGIKVVAEDVGGRLGRKVLFHVQTGRLQSALLGAGYKRSAA